ncbi:MAG TPA: hypothetical protein VJU18_00405 [Vicinamibacteria bacterium]|nr:hypothetical protein [Vicinamibacteria bacterium]
MSRSLVAASLTLGLLAGVPASGLAGGIEVRGGGFAPRAQSNLFSDVSELYNVDKKDWAGGSGGIEFSMKLVPNLELGFHVDGYHRTLDSHYRDYTRDSGREISQALELSVVPVGVSLRLVPTSRHARLAPYATVGADLFYYRYEEYGEFIDFHTPGLDISSDSFISEGVAPGFHVAGGLRVPIGPVFAFTGEVRYQWAKTDMPDDFRENKIDLSGAGVTLGMLFRF